MKNKLLYLLFFLLVLVMFSCRKQDKGNHQQDNLQTDSFAYEEDFKETEETETSPSDGSAEFDSGYEYVIPEVKDELDTCISPAFRKCIISYIDRYYTEGLDDYYCIYFFKKEANDYFTIWTLHFPPKTWIQMYSPGISFQYYWFFMHKKEIILIFNPDSDQLLPFSPCINQLMALDVTNLPKPDFGIARNLFYYRTYKYIRQDNDFYIEPLRDTIYIGNNKYLGNEIRHLKRENGLPED